MPSDGLAQSYGSGMCGLMAVVNALRVLFGTMSEDDAGKLQARMVRSLEGTGGRDLAAVLFTDGTGRAQMKRMLAAAIAWGEERGWHWGWEPCHPHPGLPADAFWSTVRIALSRQKLPAVAIAGFGTDNSGGGRYVPHWTCIEKVTRHELNLRDSAGYGVVRIGETAIRPEPGWVIQDVFLLRRTA